MSVLVLCPNMNISIFSVTLVMTMDMLLELGLMLEILCCLLNKLPIEGVQFDLLSTVLNYLLLSKD